MNYNYIIIGGGTAAFIRLNAPISITSDTDCFECSVTVSIVEPLKSIRRSRCVSVLTRVSAKIKTGYFLKNWKYPVGWRIPESNR